MKDFFDILRECPLFDQIGDENLDEMLGCLGAKKCSYKKGDTVLAEGDKAKYLGIVLKGSVQLVRVDYYGNRSILTSIEPPQLFGEAFACAGLDSVPVDVIAAEDTDILLTDAMHIARPCENACAFHRQMTLNLPSNCCKEESSYCTGKSRSLPNEAQEKS